MNNYPDVPGDLASHIGLHREMIGPQGKMFVNMLIGLCDLNPDSHVIDPGCGCGKIAMNLIPFLSSQGSYRGHDLHLPSITFCQRTFQAPNFTFTHRDVKNEYYNSSGSIDPIQDQWPYENASGDIVVALSFVTHLSRGWRQCIREAGRVLRENGYFLVTCWLAHKDEEIFSIASYEPMRRNAEGSYIRASASPDWGVGQREDEFLAEAGASGLRLRWRYHGLWRAGTPIDLWPGQDILVFQKAAR